MEVCWLALGPAELNQSELTVRVVPARTQEIPAPAYALFMT